MKKYIVIASLVVVVSSFYIIVNEDKAELKNVVVSSELKSANNKVNEDLSLNGLNSPEIKSLKNIAENKRFDEGLTDEEKSELVESVKATSHEFHEHDILEKNADLKAFRKNYYKVLKTTETQKEYEAFLANDSMYGKALSILNTNKTSFSFSDQVERMIYVDYVTEAINHLEKTGNTNLHTTIYEIVKSDIVFDKTLPEDLRKSLYADRIEIFKRYAELYKDNATLLLNQIRESKYKGYLNDVLNAAGKT